MRFYKIVKEHVAEYKRDSRTVCDCCGRDVDHDAEDLYDQSEVTIRAELGAVYPENDHRVVHEVHCCPPCFLEKVKPALEALGMKFSQRDIDEDGRVLDREAGKS